MALPLKGTVFAFESPIGKTDASIIFSGNNIVVTLQMSTVTIPISAPTSGNWYYIGVSIERTANSKSTICVVFGTSTESCSTISAYLNMNTAGDYFQIGSRFTGMIKSLQILDWPKRDYEFYNSYKTSGWTPFNGVSCTHWPIWTGTWFSSWNIDEYGSTCSKCYTPNCYSWYAYDFTVCYSWLGNYIFTYSGQSCLGYWGNGIKETILLEGCDDGNTQDGDGCSSTWAVEPGYTWSEKTPTSPSVWVRKWDYQFGYYFGVNEWNDGNDFALDGWYDWKIEHGWKWVDGSPWNPDDWSELWGDGITVFDVV